MTRFWICGPVFLAIAALPAVAHAQVDLQPFPVDWSKADQAIVDLSDQLDKPAGKEGFIRVQGAHLVKPDGSRFRFWGMNICGPNCFPEKEIASQIASDLARLGINCVRFHHMDADWGRSIFDRTRGDTRQLDAESLDRLDFFISELKSRGIYANLNLNVSRHFKAGDGVRDWKLLGAGKTATYFNARLVELQREFARQLLEHRNPYTGNEYRQEPAIAVVEIVNENSLLEGWVNWRLVGSDEKAGDTWSPLPISYANELTEQFDRWLTDRLPPAELASIRREAGVPQDVPVPRLKPDQFSQASRQRFHAEAKFYMELESRFFTDMRKLLRDDLGVRSLLVGSADHNDWISGYPHLKSNLTFDYVDGHGYWEHPSLSAETWIKNTPMVNDPLDSTVVQFARTPVAGRPFTVSETNHPFPHRYACEGVPILTAYALLHDWDGIYWFEWGAGRSDPKLGVPPHGWFNLGCDPIKVANLAACAVMWHRRDVRAAQEMVLRSYAPDQVIESLRMDTRVERPYFTPGFARSTALEHATRFALDGTAASRFPAAAPLDRIDSDTGELGWHQAGVKRGLVTIDTPRTQALIGFVRDGGHSLSQLSVEVTSEFCAIVCTSLDGRALADSRRLLLAATARGAANTGMQWREDGQTLAAWGSGPVLIEPVTGSVSLRGLNTAKRLHVQPLTGEGRPLGGKISAEQVDDGWKIMLGSPATTWYLLTVER